MSRIRGNEPLRRTHAKSKSRGLLKISGKTEEGKHVVKGIFLISSSLTGLPLDNIFQILNQENMVIDWIDYYEESLKYGWSTKTSLNRIETAVGDYFGTRHKEEVMKRLHFYIHTKLS